MSYKINVVLLSFTFSPKNPEKHGFHNIDDWHSNCDIENLYYWWKFSFALTEIHFIKHFFLNIWSNKFTICEHMQETSFKNIKKILLTRLVIYIYIIYICYLL